MPGRRAFYLHNPAGDIGHAVHVLRLLAALKARGGRNLIFLRAPSVYPHHLLENYGEVRNLPRTPTAASGRALAAALKRWRPSVLVTEFYPFGRAECRPELEPALAAARAAGAKLCASVPMPYFTAPEGAMPDLLAACLAYDRILVHSPEGADLPYMARAVSLERRVSPSAFRSFFGALRGKIVFTGWLLPERAPAVKEKDFVLVTRGGGSTSDALLEAALKAAPLVGRPVLAVAGPATPPARLEYFRRLAAAAGGNAAVLFAFADMPGLMAKAALCLSTAGGSVYEMLALRKKMVLAPYCGSKGREHSDQLARAWLARDLAGAALLLPGDLSPGKVAAALRHRLAAPLKLSPAVKPAWFRGAARSAAAIEALCR